MLFGEDWHPIEAANQFLIEFRYTPRKSKRWQNTQRASALDLAQWWTYLVANKIAWDQASSDDIADYANRMAAAVSPATGLQYSTSTVRRRVIGVETFYRWAEAKGLIRTAPQHGSSSQPPPQFPIGKNDTLLPYLGTATVTRSSYRLPRGRDPDNTPRPFNMADLSGVLARLGPSIFASDQSLIPWDAGTLPRRNRLIAEMAFHTGMRVDEVVSISAWDVLNQARQLRPGQKWQQLKLQVRTKGMDSRKVVVPSVLLRALVRYHDIERADAIVKAQQVAAASFKKFRSPAELFLNGTTANLRDVGRPISSDTASRAFTRAVLAEGLIIKREGFELNPLTGDKIYDEDGCAVIRTICGAAHTFHDLRHTFAVLFYKSEIKRGNREPWLKLKERLGHASVQTTQNVYLAHVDIDEAALSDAAAHHMRMALHVAS